MQLGDESVKPVTIGLPVYNGQDCVGEVINSLLNQTYRNIELIISDNASTDDTERICRGYAERDSRVTYIRQSKNIGPSENFLFLLRQGKGDLFMWSAHDDIWRKDYLKVAVNILATSRSAGFVFPEVVLKSIRYKIFRKVPASRFTCITEQDRNSRLLGFLNLHPYSHKLNMIYSLFRRDLLLEALEGREFIDEDLFCVSVLWLAHGELARGGFFVKRSLKKWPAMTGKKRISPEKEALFQERLTDRFTRLEQDYPHLVEKLALIRAAYRPRTYGRDFHIVDPEKLFSSPRS